jgi:hypothetical protein
MISRFVDKVDQDGIENDVYVVFLLRDWLVDKERRHNLLG